ncbi:MAG: prephenate dehydratase [Bacteroidales bacterium]|nr:prephenate dehydratase [Bacteroidales bacterium]
MMKIAIQGTIGSFHEIATRNYFHEDVELLPCETFEELTESLAEHKAEYGCLAIENSLVGSILRNYTLLLKNPVKVIGEEYLRIRQNLLALPGQAIADIREVHSHPMAIEQCKEFFKKHPHIKLINSIDTALSAKEIAEDRIEGRGAIGSALAAEIYGLENIAASIETNKENYTRFLILSHQNNGKLQHENPDKASICFSLPHQTGSLSKILSVIAFYDINLSKIESSPIMGELWRYTFYVDVMFDSYERYRQCLTAIEPLTVDLEILGEYKFGASSMEGLHKL